MRRIISLALMAFVCLTAWADEIKVGTTAEFKDAVTDHPDAYIKLTADIDLTTIETISQPFRGTIDGEGTKEINNKTEKVFFSLHGGTGNNRVKHPIFEKMEGATIKNLLIRNFRIEWDDDDIGAVAYTAKNCNFNNVIVSEVSIFNDDNEAGAIVGKAESCDFRNVRGMGNDVTVDGNRAGGFVGLSVNSRIFAHSTRRMMMTTYSENPNRLEFNYNNCTVEGEGNLE